MLVPKISTQIMFHWSDVELAIAKEMGCATADLDYVFREWMDKHDPEAGGDCSVGVHHNFDQQIAELEKTIRKDVEESGEYDDLEGEELEEAINDIYYGLSFLKAIKKVLGVHSTRACFLYSW